MAEGLKVMAMEGHGVAFLPHSAVKKELRARKLVNAAPPDLQGLEIAMEVRAYRERPTAKQLPKGTAQALWDFLARDGGVSAGLKG
jgi:DNA-binding transcriptional LysR family regulator